MDAIDERLSPPPRVTGPLVFDLPSSAMPPEAAEIEGQINDVQVEGARSVPADRLTPIWADDLGKVVPLSRLWDYTTAVREAYRDAGYPFVVVSVPPQDITDGVVRLQVTEGYIDSVLIEADLRDPDFQSALGRAERLVQRYADGLVDRDQAARLDRIERVVLLMNDIPGISANAVPRRAPAGSGAGAIQVIIKVRRDAVSGAFIADNRRSPTLGRGLAGGIVALNALSGRGDSTEIAYFNSFDVGGDNFIGFEGETDFAGAENFEEQQILQLRHRMFLGRRGGQLVLSGIFGRNKPGGDFQDLDFEGEQIVLEAAYARPLRRQRGVSAWAEAGLRFVDSTSEVSNGTVTVSDDKIRALFLEARALRRQARSADYAVATLRLSQGLPVLDASDQPTPTDSAFSRFDAEADFTKAKFDVEVRESLPAELILRIEFSAQAATKPLLAAEEFSVGGLSLARAYDPAEETGDHGVGGSLELSRRFDAARLVRRPQAGTDGPGLVLEPFAFVDGGAVWNFEPESEESDTPMDDPDTSEGFDFDAQLASAGAGLRLHLPSGLTAEIEVAQPLSGGLGRNQSSDPRLFFDLIKRF